MLRPPDMVHIITIAIVVFLLGRVFFGRSASGAGSLGLLVGLALGLSASPVLAAVLTGVLTLAGVVAPLYFKLAGRGSGAGDNTWMNPLTSWAVLGLLMGIFLRANDALNFTQDLRTQYAAQGFTESQVEAIMEGRALALAGKAAEPAEPNLRTQYAAQGFTPEQIEKIMEGQAAALARSTPGGASGGEEKEKPSAKAKEKGDGEEKDAGAAKLSFMGRTNLQSREQDPGWAKLLADLVRPEDTPEKNLERVKKAVAPPDLQRILWLEQQGATPEQVLEQLKEWHTKEKRP